MLLKIGIILSALAVQTRTEKCVTPNNEQAECVSLYSCPVLIATLATRQNASIEFLRQSSCGGTPSDPMVCCGSSSGFTSAKENSKTNQRQNVTKMSLLPTRRYCGLQHSDDYFHITNDTSTKITEFPWLARIIFDEGNSKRRALCAGSLINARYVLTVAHCVVTRTGHPVAVHLGEYHVNNKTDCVQEPPFEEECSEPLTEVGIEKAIPHHSFDPRKKINNIALVRLNRTISYSDYIRPVCLPFPGTTLAKDGDVLTASGWGFRDFGGDAAEIKKKYLGRLITNEQCAKAYPRIDIQESHLCTIALNSTTDIQCQGDSGGPLVFSHRDQWHQEGIISFGAACGAESPDVHTKVVNYLDWILENIEK